MARCFCWAGPVGVCCAACHQAADFCVPVQSLLKRERDEREQAEAIRSSRGLGADPLNLQVESAQGERPQPLPLAEHSDVTS